MKKTNINWKQVGTAAAAALIVGATLGATFIPREIPVEVPVEKQVTVVEYIDVPVPYEVEKIVEKEVIVEVDNGNLDLVLEYVYENGELEFITEDLFDDEIDVIVERILLIEEVKAVSEDYALANFARELEKQHDYDRRDISRVKLVEDSVEFLKESANFKYGDFETKLSIEFRYDGVVEERDVIVEYYNGRVRSLLIE